MFQCRCQMRARHLLPRGFRDRLDLHRTAVDRFVRGCATRVKAGERLLDAGAGESPFREAFAHARYVAVDRAVGDDRWDYGGLSVLGDLLELPFRTGSFDWVLCTETLEHVTEPGRVVDELARVLRPGGRLCVTVPFSLKEHQQPHDYYRFTRYGLAYLCERAGLEVEHLEPQGGYFRMLGDKLQPAHRYLFGKQRHLLWRIVSLPLYPVSFLGFSVLAPMVCAKLDWLDGKRVHTSGFELIARRKESAT